jgi:hypothetical protein
LERQENEQQTARFFFSSDGKALLRMRQQAVAHESGVCCISTPRGTHSRSSCGRTRFTVDLNTFRHSRSRYPITQPMIIRTECLPGSNWHDSLFALVSRASKWSLPDFAWTRAISPLTTVASKQAIGPRYDCMALPRSAATLCVNNPRHPLDSCQMPRTTAVSAH